jgi:hypothetical protein
MTREEWLACTEPARMLQLLGDRGLLGERKARLFGAACCRRLWRLLSEEGRQVVAAVERQADGLAGWDELEASRTAFLSGEGAVPQFFVTAAVSCLLADAGPDPTAYVLDLSHRAAQAAGGHAVELAAQADLLRCLFGPPPLGPAEIRPEWLSWGDAVVPRLALGIYEEGAFDPFDRMPILADAKEEARRGHPQKCSKKPQMRAISQCWPHCKVDGIPWNPVELTPLYYSGRGFPLLPSLLSGF